MSRPPEGSRWWLGIGSRYQPVEVLAPSEDAYDMVACLTTRSYTKKDQWGWSYKVAKGQKTYVPVEHLRQPANDIAQAWSTTASEAVGQPLGHSEARNVRSERGKH